jgi:EpsD family peptidyl-prolyl cis-trans isomerase
MKPLSTRALALVLLSVLGLAACNRGGPKPTTQVAAKVGNEEISLHQINTVLAQSNSRGATPEQVQMLSRKALEGLIDQQVAVAQAIELNLNRDPDVIAQLEAARRGVLANAYVKQYLGSLPKPEVTDAKTYYVNHPALFAERRIYNVQEVVVPRSPEVLEQLSSMTAANKPMEEAVGWLKSRQLGFIPTNASRTAEQIPLDLLPRMHALKDGQDLVFSTPATVTMLRLVASRSEPLSETEALPRITQYLGTQRAVEAITGHIKELRGKTTVVYLGEFAPSDQDGQPAALAPSPSSSSPGPTL